MVLRSRLKGRLKGEVDLVDRYYWTTSGVIGDLALKEYLSHLRDTKWVAMLLSNLQQVVFLKFTLRFFHVQQNATSQDLTKEI